jgi:hypothetical protein
VYLFRALTSAEERQRIIVRESKYVRDVNADVNAQKVYKCIMEYATVSILPSFVICFTYKLVAYAVY